MNSLGGSACVLRPGVLLLTPDPSFPLPPPPQVCSEATLTVWRKGGSECPPARPGPIQEPPGPGLSQGKGTCHPGALPPLEFLCQRWLSTASASSPSNVQLSLAS